MVSDGDVGSVVDDAGNMGCGGVDVAPDGAWPAHPMGPWAAPGEAAVYATRDAYVGSSQQGSE